MLKAFTVLAHIVEFFSTHEREMHYIPDVQAKNPVTTSRGSLSILLAPFCEEVMPHT